MRAEEVIREAAGLCRKYHAKEVILFGSRAKETAHPRSDIDLAVSGYRILTCCWKRSKIYRHFIPWI